MGSFVHTFRSGADRFSFYYPYYGVDTITDFLVSQGDTIGVSAYRFNSGLVAGAAITPIQFVLGTAAQNADNRFIYNTATGALSFDGDGAGGAAAVQLAVLSTKPSLTSDNIFVIA